MLTHKHQNLEKCMGCQKNCEPILFSKLFSPPKMRVGLPLGNGKGPHPLGRGFAACPRGPPSVGVERVA